MTWDELHGVLRASGATAAAPTWDPASAGFPNTNPTITGVAYDSRAVERGGVFVALKGLHADGTAFVRQALDRGAAAIVSEEPPSPGVAVPWAVVNDARLALERAEATRAQAARDLQVTRSRLALLPDLPVGAGSGGAPTATAVATGNAQPTTGQAGGTTAAAATAGSATQTGARQ